MRKLITPFLLLLLFIIVFHSWFLPGLLSTFDFPYYSSLMMKDASIIPYAWGFHVGLDGFAKFISPYSWVLPFIYAPQVIFGSLGVDWGFIERITYLYPLLILLFFSPVVLFKTIFPKNKFYLISVIVFSFNTYSLLLAGGEIFVALAYFLIPLVLAIFIKIVNGARNQTSKITYSVIAGMFVSLQIMFDPRVAYVTISVVILYLLFTIYYLLSERKVFYVLHLMFYVFVIPGVIAVLLHAFWVLPTIFYGVNPVKSLGAGYSSIDAVRFLSFAKFENTISLLHPNWPENIFGKVYFMRPEFLLLPILAFASLMFVTSSKLKTENLKPKTNLIIIFFALLGLIGAFLAKGVNEPFGGIYQWMFNYIPGFIMFRDPAKWYPLVALSYSMLIPYSVYKIFEWLKLHNKFPIFNFQFLIKNKILNLQNLFLTLVILYLLFLIRPAIFGQLGGMFKATSIPDDYVRLEKFLVNQPDYFRTLWVPSKQKFGFYSNNHPEMSAQVLFNVTDNKSLFKKLAETKTKKFLKESSIKYVVIPYDSEKEIFLSDRKYDDGLYKKTLNDVSKIGYLKKIEGFGKIGVFTLSNSKDHFWTTSNTLSLKYQFISPVEYRLEVENAKKGDIIIFSEKYDSKWVAETLNFKLQTSKYDGRFNSFILPGDGNYSLKVYYASQDFVNIGLVISGITLFISVGSLLFLKFKKK